MSKPTKRLQRMAEKMCDVPFGRYAKGLAATKFSATATPASSRGAGAYARYRALAGLSSGD